MIVRLVLAALGAASLSGCVTYQAAPVDPVKLAQSYQQRTLDVAAVKAEVSRIAPSARWTGETWDRLSLFAAAIQSSPSIAEARARVAALAAASRAAAVGPPMTLTLAAEYAGKASGSSPWLYGVTSDILLDLGARKSNRIDTARFAAMTARYDYAETVWTARMAIRRSLADRMLADREIAVGEKLAEIRLRQVTALERRVAGGEAIRSDLERVRGDAAADARRTVDAEARKVAAEIALAEAIGISPSMMKSVALSWDGFDAALTPPGGDFSLKASDLTARADILRAVAGYDQAEANLRAEVGKQWPDIHLGPGYTWERGLVKLPFTLALALPPADLNRGAIETAEARRAEAGVHLEAVIARAQAAIEGALIERDAAGAALERVRGVELPTARRIAAQAEDELANGAIDRVDWSAAQVLLLLAERAEIDALRRVHAADAALEDALRRPLSGPELLIAAPTQERPQ